MTQDSPIEVASETGRGEAGIDIMIEREALEMNSCVPFSLPGIFDQFITLVSELRGIGLRRVCQVCTSWTTPWCGRKAKEAVAGGTEPKSSRSPGVPSINLLKEAERWSGPIHSGIPPSGDRMEHDPLVESKSCYNDRYPVHGDTD